MSSSTRGKVRLYRGPEQAQRDGGIQVGGQGEDTACSVCGVILPAMRAPFSDTHLGIVNRKTWLVPNHRHSTTLRPTRNVPRCAGSHLPAQPLDEAEL